MNIILYYLIAGASIGTTLALLPSPLLALMINETLKYGRGEGIKIAMVPSLTDLPVIMMSLLIMFQLQNLNMAFGIISIAGSLFLGYLGIKSFFSHGVKTDDTDVKPQSIRKGVITNFLNPNPYIFWFTVGTPMIIRGWKSSPAAAFVYLGGFLLTLIGIRVLLTLLIHKSREFLNSAGYIIVSKILSIVLMLFSLKLCLQGIDLLLK